MGMSFGFTTMAAAQVQPTYCYVHNEDRKIFYVSDAFLSDDDLDHHIAKAFVERVNSSYHEKFTVDESDVDCRSRRVPSVSVAQVQQMAEGTTSPGYTKVRVNWTYTTTVSEARAFDSHPASAYCVLWDKSNSTHYYSKAFMTKDAAAIADHSVEKAFARIVEATYHTIDSNKLIMGVDVNCPAFRDTSLSDGQGYLDRDAANALKVNYGGRIVHVNWAYSEK